MLHTNHRWLTTCLALLVVFSILLATPRLAFAEGDAPEDAPPAVAPPAEQPVDISPVETAVQDLAAADASLVNNNGVAIPMASQSALDILCEPDPWYFGACPGGKCSYIHPDTGLRDALLSWIANKGVGMIYLQGDFNQTYDVVINGTNEPGYQTLRGIMWDTTTIGGKPVLYGNMRIEDLNNGFTLQGLDVYGGISFSGNKGLIKVANVFIDQDESGIGLQIINHTGMIDLNQVRVELAEVAGVYLNNNTGPLPTGAIKISNLTIKDTKNFGTEYSQGLYIESRSPITLNGIYLEENRGGGVFIQNYGAAVTIKNGYIGWSRVDSHDGSGYGLRIWSEGLKGTITLENLRIYDNEWDGIHLQNVGAVTLNNVFSSGNIHNGLFISDEGESGPHATSLVINNSEFNWNAANGARVHVKGAATITNTSFSGNYGGNGLYAKNTYTTAPITLTGVTADENNRYGLHLISKSNVTLLKVDANRNPEYGANIDVFEGLGSVTISRSNFNENTYGLKVFGSKNITLNGVRASGNEEYGAHLNNRDNPLSIGTVSILSTLGAWNEFNNKLDSDTNFGYGLQILSSGAVTLNNVMIDGNKNFGLEIENSLRNLGAPVTLNSVEVTHNGSYGVKVSTSGAFTWNYGSASQNEQTSLANFYGGLTLENTSLIKPVMIKNVYFDGNKQGNGLKISNLGLITLNQVSASGNAGQGAYLNNFDGIGGVTLLGSGYSGNQFFDNGGNGLEIATWGAVTITNIDAGGNNGYGATIDNSTGPFGVSILAGAPFWMNTFNGNHLDGLDIFTLGNIKLVNVSANDNWAWGGFLVNSGDGWGTVTLSSLSGMINEFNNNGHGDPEISDDESITDGLYIDSWNSITLNNISASDNSFNGVFMGYNYDETSIGSIIVNNLWEQDFSNNGWYGLVAYSMGSITIKGVLADHNAYGGAYLNNEDSYLYKPVTVSNSSFHGTSMGKVWRLNLQAKSP